MPIIARDGAPPHLFDVPELDVSTDLFAEPLKDHWFRLAAITRGNEADARGIRDVTERQSFLLERGAFEAIEDKFGASTSPISGMGHPHESTINLHAADEHYIYEPFHQFNVEFTDVMGEPIGFFPEAEGERDVMLNPDLALYFRLVERPHGSGNWWDPARSVEVIRQEVVGHLEFVDVRVDYLRKYLRARQRSLVVGHYRHFHLLAPSQAVRDAVVQGQVLLRGADGAKAFVGTYENKSGIRDDLLIRRLHLWFQVPPPPLEIDTMFDEEADFDITKFTLPTRNGDVAPARFKQSPRLDRAAFAGVDCDFMDHVYFQQDVLSKYQGASGFSINDEGAVRCGSHWGLTRSTHRIGNALLSTMIGDFAEGVPLYEWPHWKQFAVAAPATDTLKALDAETPIPKAVNAVVREFESLNEAFERFAAAAAAPVKAGLWKGSLDGLAGRQLKWVYPSSADDAEFLTRATLASTLFIDTLDVESMRRVLMTFGPSLHQNKEGRTVSSRNLLQRVALVAELVCTKRPKRDEVTDLVTWSETGAGAEPNLQIELTRNYEVLRREFAPLAFLYDLRVAGGLAHPPSPAKAASAAKNFGLAEKGWRRIDYLRVLQKLGEAVEQVTARIDAAADSLS